MFVFLVHVAHEGGQVRGQGVGHALDEAVAACCRQVQFGRPAVEGVFPAEEVRDVFAAKAVDDEVGVAAVAFGDVVAVTVHVFAGDGQVFEGAEDVAAQVGEGVGVVCADVVGLLARGFGKGVNAHGEDDKAAGRTGGLIEAAAVVVVARGGVGVDVAHAGLVFVVGGLAACRLDVGVRVVAVLQAVEQGFGVAAEVKAEVVDEFKLAVFVQAGVGGHFGVGGAAMDERAAAVVADAADDGGADAGGADDAMRFAANGGEGVFKFVEGGTGQGDGLFAVFDEADAFQAARGDEDDRAVVIAVGG
ncbi:hypothetical protein HMPREF9080_01073 [Cardiobacterium valvarum F0432]|uniref:Uncharacterized protein n=1 Tax=Cardiobacterium valvarum F0432 TaxID=797473 RepID=G9ZEC2_9GAMM|nr:hypothetical protein HMPREF9080_01073 [Cardiobacterium valvarum F0432]